MTWDILIELLEPLYTKGYLTTYIPETSTWCRGQLLVVGTGLTPLHRVLEQSPRFIFYDAPLRQLTGHMHIPATASHSAYQVEFSPEVSPIASSRFPVSYYLALVLPKLRPLNPYMELLRLYSDEAIRKGIQSRWWGIPRHPWFLRKRLWKLLKKSGTYWISADDPTHLLQWIDDWELRRQRKVFSKNRSPRL